MGRGIQLLRHMEVVAFNPSIHSVEVVAQLIYETEPDFFSLYFGKKKKAVKRIQNLVLAGKNFFGQEFIHVAEEDKTILGMTLSYTGGDINRKQESQIINKTMDFLGLLRLILIYEFFISRILTIEFEKDELYLSNICVNKNHRGKGVGSALLDHIIKQAKEKHCNSIVLDVKTENNIALNLYKKVGFDIVDMRFLKLFRASAFKMVKIVSPKK